MSDEYEDLVLINKELRDANNRLNLALEKVKQNLAKTSEGYRKLEETNDKIGSRMEQIELRLSDALDVSRKTAHELDRVEHALKAMTNRKDRLVKQLDEYRLKEVSEGW